tara:strand:+ start:1203 stop:1520 length:318 start_codon:yes stop_codon:yes gene_type:complete
MNKAFWDKMEGVSRIMTELENEHKPFFSIDEEQKLLDYKENFIKSCIFWNDANNVSDKEKVDRITWEYNNMFDRLCELINNNVDEYEEIDKDYEIEVQDDKEDEF